MRLWLEDQLSDLFGIDQPLQDGTADETYDRVVERLRRPKCGRGHFTGASVSRCRYH